jgi:hypothetical protein
VTDRAVIAASVVMVKALAARMKAQAHNAVRSEKQSSDLRRVRAHASSLRHL